MCSEHIFAAAKAPLWPVPYSVSFLGNNILIGNFCAIFSSAICAIYNSFSSNVLVERKCPIAVYFGLLSLYTIVISYILAQVIGEDVELLSFNSTVGFFGLFSNQ